MRIAAALLVSLSCWSAHGQSLSYPEVDHVVLGISDLQKGIDEFEALTGVRPTFGGEHDDLGTHDAIVSLGPGQYLEILAPRPGASLREDVQFLESLSELKPFLWQFRVEDADDTAARLRQAGYPTLPVVEGSRKAPDGSTVTYRQVLPENPLLYDPTPAIIFVEWAAGSAHPSSQHPAGCVLQSLDYKHPESELLNEIFEVLGFRLRVNPGNTRNLTVQLACPDGTVEF